MGPSSSPNNLGSYGGASELSSSNQLRLIGPKSVKKNRENHIKKKRNLPNLMQITYGKTYEFVWY